MIKEKINLNLKTLDVLVLTCCMYPNLHIEDDKLPTLKLNVLIIDCQYDLELHTVDMYFDAKTRNVRHIFNSNPLNDEHFRNNIKKITPMNVVIVDKMSTIKQLFSINLGGLQF